MINFESGEKIRCYGNEIIHFCKLLICLKLQDLSDIKKERGDGK